MSDKDSSETSNISEEPQQNPEVPKYDGADPSISKESKPIGSTSDDPKQISTGDNDKSVSEPDPQEKAKIEEEIKNIAKEYEQQEDAKPRPKSVRLLITFSFLFGPIFYGILSISEGLFSSFRSLVEIFSLSVTLLLLLSILLVSYRKSKR